MPASYSDLGPSPQAVDPELVLRRLLWCRVVEPRDVLNSEFSIEPAGGHNRAYLLRTSAATLLVKQLADKDRTDRELMGLRVCSSLGDRVRSADIRFVDGPMVVTASPPKLLPLTEGPRRGRYRRSALRSIGSSLAHLHRVKPPLAARPTNTVPFDPRGASPLVINESRAVRQLIAQYQADGELADAVASLGAETSACTRSYIHGDIRAANLLLQDEPTKVAAVWFVDWEASGCGDPSVDVGAAVATVLAHSLRRSPDGPDRVGVDVLVNAYRLQHGPLHLARSLRRAGTSLLQFAIEDATAATGVTSFARRASEVGRMAIVSPELLAVHLGLV